jgi:hypothetical protein
MPSARARIVSGGATKARQSAKWCVLAINAIAVPETGRDHAISPRPQIGDIRVNNKIIRPAADMRMTSLEPYDAGAAKKLQVGRIPAP